MPGLSVKYRHNSDAPDYGAIDGVSRLEAVRYRIWDALDGVDVPADGTEYPVA